MFIDSREVESDALALHNTCLINIQGAIGVEDIYDRYGIKCIRTEIQLKEIAPEHYLFPAE
jgi:hypothetical protein